MTVSVRQRYFKIPLFVYVLGAVLLGASVGKIWMPQWIDSAIYIALFLMLFPPMLEVNFTGVTRVFKEPRLVTVALLLNFLVSPLLIFGLLHLFVGAGEAPLMVGIILYGSVPGGGMAPAFTGMLKGNVSLTVTIAAIGSILSLGIVPLWAKFLTGTQVQVPALLIFEHLCFIVVIPLALGVLTRRIVVWKKGESTFCSVKERLKPLSNLGLFLILFAMSLLYGDRVLSDPYFVLKIAAPVAAFLTILFVISGAIGKAFAAPYEDAIALTLSTTAKNNAISLALAFSTFGADAGLVNAIAGPLVQLPILLAFVALRTGNKT
ncbi:MAG: bile acid:sodium symporter [Thermodesulfobacteriota bacterium]